jgi:hypothetical protein
VAASWDLLERATAAAQNGANIHDGLCQVFEEPGGDGQPWPCTCGIPDLLRDLAEHLQQAAGAELVRKAVRAQRAA